MGILNEEEQKLPTSSKKRRPKNVDREELLDGIADPELELTHADVIRIAFDNQIGLASLLATMLKGKFAGELHPNSRTLCDVFVYNGVYWEKDVRRECGDCSSRLLKILRSTQRAIAAAKEVNKGKGFLSLYSKVLTEALKAVTKISSFNAIVNRAFEGSEGCGVPSCMWDQDKLTLTTCANVVDLRDGSVLDPDPEDYRRRHAVVEYFENLEEPTAFIKALSESLGLLGCPEEPEYLDERVLERALSDAESRFGFAFLDDGPNEQVEAARRELDAARRTNAELRESYDQRMEAWNSGEVTKEVVDFMQVLLGYCLLGTNQNEKFIVFVGDKGRNGKGILCHTLRRILGDYAYEARSETFMRGRQRGGGDATSDIMALKGRRIVFISENDRGDAINAPLIKRITGHDEMSGRELYGAEQTFAPSCVPILLTNFFPHIDSEDHALLRRCICIPFQRTFKDDPDPENPAEGQIDYGLEEKLKAEYPQILSWLVRGAVRFQQEGLKIPSYIEVAAKEYRNDKDVLGLFLGRYCTSEDFVSGLSGRERHPAKIQSSVLYGAFAQWCHEANLKLCSAIVFKSRMQAKGYKYTKNSSVYVIGLRFKDGEDGDNLYDAYMRRHRRENGY